MKVIEKKTMKICAKSICAKPSILSKVYLNLFDCYCFQIFVVPMLYLLNEVTNVHKISYLINIFLLIITYMVMFLELARKKKVSCIIQ